MNDTLNALSSVLVYLLRFAAAPALHAPVVVAVAEQPNLLPTEVRLDVCVPLTVASTPGIAAPAAVFAATR